MSRQEIDAYLAGVEEPKRSTLERLRQDILSVVPQAEQCISYKVPAFRVEGQVVAGFAAFKNHLAYLPFSGGVLKQLAEADKSRYGGTEGSLHFPPDKPLPKRLVKRLIDLRLAEVRSRQSGYSSGMRRAAGKVSVRKPARSR